MTSTSLSTLFLYLDIETIPSQDPKIRAEIDAKHTVPALDLESIQPAANLKDPEKVAADLEKRRAKALEDHAAAVAKAAAAAEEEYRKTALDGTTGHIACASVALNDDEIINVQNAALGLFTKPTVVVAASPDAVGQIVTIRPGFQMVLDDERKMICNLFEAIDAALISSAMDRGEEEMGIPTLVAHHAQFDVRFVWQRAIVLGVKVPAWWPHDARPWDTERLQDTMTGWAGHGNRIGLDRLCRALGIQGKGDIDGSKVWDAVQAGRINAVCQYCDDDVERLRKVHGRITGRVRVIARGSRPTDPIEPMPDDLPDFLPSQDHRARERGTSPHLSER